MTIWPDIGAGNMLARLYCLKKAKSFLAMELNRESLEERTDKIA